jgi:hypothetical protein
MYKGKIVCLNSKRVDIHNDIKFWQSWTKFITWNQSPKNSRIVVALNKIMKHIFGIQISIRKVSKVLWLSKILDLVPGKTAGQRLTKPSISWDRQKLWPRAYINYFLGPFFNLSWFLVCMQDVLFDLTWHSSQNAKLVPVARHIHVSPYNI